MASYLAAASVEEGVQLLGSHIEGQYNWFWRRKEGYDGSSNMQGLHRRFMPLLDTHHTSSLMYRHCCKCLNECNNRFNARFSIVDDEMILPQCGKPSSTLVNMAIPTHPHPKMHRTISWSLMLCPPCEPSATNHMNSWLVALKSRHQNCYYIEPNVICIVDTTEILIVINVVNEVSNSLEITNNVILYLVFCHNTVPGQVIKGLDFRLWIFHHSLDRHYS